MPTMNLKSLMTGVAVLCTSLTSVVTSHAQSAYPVESSWTITDQSNQFVEITMRFRNTQGVDPSRIFGITSVGFSYNGSNAACVNSFDFCRWSSPNFSIVGSVDQAPFFIDGHPVSFSLVPLGFSYAPNGSSASFGPMAGRRGPGQDTWGVLGCQTVPDIPALAWTSWNFAGRTCTDDGFDGWIEVSSRFDTGGPSNTGFDASLLTAADFSAGAGGEYLVLPTPEPGSYAFLAMGLVAIALARRKRDAA